MEDIKPGMKAVKKVSVEQVVEAEHGRLHLENVVIAGKVYTLDIHNYSLAEGEERLSLDFNNGDYQIIIEKDGIRFVRTLYRPEHDHNDSETLQVGVDNRHVGIKKGETKWFSRSPDPSDGTDYFRVKFGAEIE